jgi:hypothetical protein
MDIFHPNQWSDFFLLVGTGAATLTGLIFIALTIHLRILTQDLVHRGRALSSLTGLVVAFLQCSVVLLPNQAHKLIGIELMLLALIGVSVFLLGIYRTVKSNIHTPTFSNNRAITGILLYLIEMTGSLILVLGHISGLYITALGILANLFFIVTGAWILVVGPASKH